MIHKKDCLKIREIAGTPGGTTYFVIRKDDPDRKERPMCFRQIKRGNLDPDLRCSMPAGAETDHKGTGACANHGGTAYNGAKIVSGTQAIMTRKSLQERIERFMADGSAQLMNLSSELATARAVFEEMMGEFPAPHDETYGLWVKRMDSLVNTIGNLVEKISRVESRNTLTAAQALYLKAVVADILQKYIKDPEARVRAVKELTSRVEGQDNVTKYVNPVPEKWSVEEIENVR